VSVRTRGTAGRDVDIAHIFMGTSMAGMFITDWAFGPSAFWELVFTLLLVWFLVRSVQSIVAFGIHLTHYLIHAAMSLAMLLMYLFPGGATNMSMSMSMSMSASSSARIDPALGSLLAVSFFVSAVFTLASPVKGVSHHGRHAPAYAVSGQGGRPVEDPNGLFQAAAPSGVVRLITAPWLEDVSHVVMCVAMGFMLILLL
jgi:small-conductance mechanosensitive channel